MVQLLIPQYILASIILCFHRFVLVYLSVICNMILCDCILCLKIFPCIVGPDFTDCFSNTIYLEVGLKGEIVDITLIPYVWTFLFHFSHI